MATCCKISCSTAQTHTKFLHCRPGKQGRSCPLSSSASSTSVVPPKEHSLQKALPYVKSFLAEENWKSQDFSCQYGLCLPVELQKGWAERSRKTEVGGRRQDFCACFCFFPSTSTPISSQKQPPSLLTLKPDVPIVLKSTYTFLCWQWPYCQQQQQQTHWREPLLQPNIYIFCNCPGHEQRAVGVSTFKISAALKPSQRGCLLCRERLGVSTELARLELWAQPSCSSAGHSPKYWICWHVSENESAVSCGSLRTGCCCHLSQTTSK